MLGGEGGVSVGRSYTRSLTILNTNKLLSGSSIVGESWPKLCID
jgi:hypothetical protein